mmetsp:Transcript_22088/g.16497  ORF Transcript_22088/g.16497 Transcript_22088/m.16497 type:complete len:91 (-) Transcript_22088:2852-3124(-)
MQLNGVLGECASVRRREKKDEDGFSNYLVCGENGVAIFNGKEITHKVKTEFKAKAAIFYDTYRSYSILVILGEDGRFRFIKWKKQSMLFG